MCAEHAGLGDGAGRRAAGGHQRGTGQRGSVDHQVGLHVARGPRDAVGEDESTLGVGVVDLDGFARVHVQDVVRTVGVGTDCVLGETFGFCPVARCAKSLLNGPCGGTRRDGMCEIDEKIDCVWNLIVERANERGQLESLSKLQKTKNWSNSHHGGPKRVIREDLRQ